MQNSEETRPIERPVTVAMASRRLGWGDLAAAAMDDLIRLAREEDLDCTGLRVGTAHFRRGDATTEALNPKGNGSARLVARQDLVVCGIPLLERILMSYCNGTITPRVAEGDAVKPGTEIAVISGPISGLLQAERVLLNFIQHLSGVASQTRAYAELLQASTTRLVDTRKTTPGFRLLEKVAVATGGGWNHRLGLYDRVLIKDNHLAACGSIAGDALAAAVAKIRSQRPDLVVECEVDSPRQIEPVIEAGADIILLDNFSTVQLQRAVDRIGGRALTEASGGITRERLPELAAIGLDFISTGALVHQSTWRDIGLDWGGGGNE